METAQGKIVEGDLVSWLSETYSKGLVTTIYSSGYVPYVEGSPVEASSDSPAARIQVYEEVGHKWEPTDVFIAKSLQELSICTAVEEEVAEYVEELSTSAECPVANPSSEEGSCNDLPTQAKEVSQEVIEELVLEVPEILETPETEIAAIPEEVIDLTEAPLIDLPTAEEDAAWLESVIETLAAENLSPEEFDNRLSDILSSDYLY